MTLRPITLCMWAFFMGVVPSLKANPAPPAKVALRLLLVPERKAEDKTRDEIFHRIQEGFKGTDIDLITDDKGEHNIPTLQLTVSESRDKETGNYEAGIQGTFYPIGPWRGQEAAVRTAQCRTRIRREPDQVLEVVGRGSLAVTRTLLVETWEEGCQTPKWILDRSDGSEVQEIDASLVRAAKAPRALEYPLEARRQGIEGVVILEITAEVEGKVRAARTVGGPEILAGAALKYAMGLDFKIPAPHSDRPAVSFLLSVKFQLEELSNATKVILGFVAGPTLDARLKPDLEALRVSVTAMLQGHGISIVQTDDGDPLLRFLEIQVETFRSRTGTCLVGIYGKLSHAGDRSVPGRDQAAGGSPIRSNRVLGLRETLNIQELIARTAEDVIRMIIINPQAGGRARGYQPMSTWLDDVQFFDFSQIRIRRQPPAPPYPAYARKHRVQGLVIVEVVVDELGKPLTATVLDGPPELFLTAVGYALDWEFEPAAFNGVPVKAKFKLTMPFRLR